MTRPARTAATDDLRTDPVWREVTVGDVRYPATDVVVLTLFASHGSELPSWSAGAHIDIELDTGVVRQYSLCGVPGAACWRVAVLWTSESRGGSARVHRLRAGDELRVRGPRNHFPLDDADEYIFIAGGIGITPILPMVQRAQASGIPWTLHYGGRDQDSMAFTDQLARYGDKVHLYPQDQVGMLDLPEILGKARKGVGIYCCGPEALLTAVESATASWPGGSLHVERFSPAEPVGPRADDVIFDVECRLSGVTVTVGAEETILEAMERAGGVITAASCREGTCGTCEATVIDGVPDHRDSVLTDTERDAGDVIMTCVSRARTPRLVLEL